MLSRILLILMIAIGTPSFSIESDCVSTNSVARTTPEDFDILKGKIEKNEISYAEFQGFVKDNCLTQEQIDDLLDYADKVYSPILFTAVSPDALVHDNDYSLNLLWIHQDTQQFDADCHLMGNAVEGHRRFNETVLLPIQQWQTKQPGAHINYWYDGQMFGCNDHRIVDNTRRYLGEAGINLENVQIRDIREILATEADIEPLFSPTIPVYFRADLAKALIGDYVLQEVPYAVVSDLDICPIVKEQMFSKWILGKLNRVGHVMNNDVRENSFMILHRPFQKIHRSIVIDGITNYALEKLANTENFSEQCVCMGEGGGHSCWGYAGLRSLIEWTKLNPSWPESFAESYTEFRQSFDLSEIRSDVFGISLIHRFSRFSSSLGYREEKVEELKKLLAAPSDVPYSSLYR